MRGVFYPENGRPQPCDHPKRFRVTEWQGEVFIKKCCRCGETVERRIPNQKANEVFRPIAGQQ